MRLLGRQPAHEAPFFNLGRHYYFDTFFFKHFIYTGVYKCIRGAREVSYDKHKSRSFYRERYMSIIRPHLFELNAELAEWDTHTFYSGGDKGYTDYPMLDATR